MCVVYLLLLCWSVQCSLPFVAEAFDPAEYFDTAPELLTRKYNRPRTATLAQSMDAPSSKQLMVRAGVYVCVCACS